MNCFVQHKQPFPHERIAEHSESSKLTYLQFGLFHGDPHPGNIFALRDGRIGYVDFGNVAELSQRNKQTLIDAVVHAVNEDYKGMADDFVQLVRSHT